MTVKSTKSNNFQPFSKPLRVKQPVDSKKQQVVFHLVWKTFNFKMDHTLFYWDPTHTQQQHQPFMKHLGFGFFKSSWSLEINNLPLFDEDKSLVACVGLVWIWNSTCKTKTMQSRASLIAGYDDTLTSFLHNHKSRKTSLKLCKNI